MKTAIINLSPRTSGTSAMLANLCAASLAAGVIDLYPNLKRPEVILEKIEESDTVILSGPCYVDSYPADTVYLLEQIKEHSDILHGQNLYGIIQGGMPYVHTHESGLKMLQLFCRDCNLNYKGGFVLGMGAMLDGKPLSKLPNAKKAEKAFAEFLHHIKIGEESPAKLYYEAQAKIPVLMCRYLSHRMNKTIDKDLKKRGIDYRQPSPYYKTPIIS